MTISFSVPGIPQTAGSKRAFPFQKGNGKLGVRVSDDNPRGRDWKVAVVAAFRDVYRGPALDGPLVLHVRFRLPRPKGHFGARGIKVSAPLFPETRPDCTKMLRCLEDALNGLAWRDDSQIVCQMVTKMYGDPGADVVIEPTRPASVSDMARYGAEFAAALDGEGTR